jgi:hypothetical protein
VAIHSKLLNAACLPFGPHNFVGALETTFFDCKIYRT